MFRNYKRTLSFYIKKDLNLLKKADPDRGSVNSYGKRFGSV